MPDERLDRMEEVYHAARQRPVEEREAFLDEACSDDADLRREVESLLKYADQATGADATTSDVADASTPPSMTNGDHTPLGTRIGPYKLLEQIGEGGFGVVYMAEQRAPIHRKVALKVIKLGMDTKQVIARFEAERQALAMMDHPNIARVLDAGATDEGKPYFVMEYVRGDPITEYCDRNNLSVPERLELFSEVCHAVQHAHQKGIIHRDIKPSNVLVTFMDGSAVPKVIDFGIAKATNAKLTEKTLFTEHRQMIGTPEYMSPEQAEMSGVDIDTRSDVYSLGVLLYELLTGVTPFDPEKLRSAAYGEIQRIIREEDPPKPSTRLSTLGDQLPGISAHRGIEPKKLGILIRGELDWIVMRCMEKDRTRRYATAIGLAADVLRHLNDEPVEASPPSRSYRLRKLVRRNKGAFAAAALVFLALTLGIIGTTYGLVIAEREAERAEAAAHRALAAQAEERARAEEVELVAEFQQSQLAGIDTELTGVRLRSDIIDKRRASLSASGLDEPTIEDALAQLESSLAGVNFTNVAKSILDENILERALLAIDEQFQNQALVRARLLQTVADTARAIGLLDRAKGPQIEAVEIRRRVLGDEHPHTLTSISAMGMLLRDQGNLVEAERYYREAMETRRRILGADHPHTLASISSMGLVLQDQGKLADAERYHREALETNRRALGDEHHNTLASINNMGFLLQAQGNHAEAERYYGEALEAFRRIHGDEHPDTLRSINNMGLLRRQQGHLAEAERYYREAMETRRRIHGDEHPSTLLSMNNMGTLLRAQGKIAEAETHYRAALDGRRRVLGNEHPHTLNSMTNMSGVLAAQGKLAEAERYAREALEASRQVLGDEHSNTLTMINNMGYLLRQQGRLDEAEVYFREAMETRRRVLGDEHPDTLMSIGSIGFLLQAQGKLAKAEPYLREALEAFRRIHGNEHPHTLISIDSMGSLLRALDRFDEAERLGAEAVAGARAALPAGHWRTAAFLTEYALTLAAMEHFAEAAESMLEAHAISEATLGEKHDRTTGIIKALANLYDDWHAAEADSDGEYDVKAAEWRAKLAALQEDDADDTSSDGQGEASP